LLKSFILWLLAFAAYAAPPAITWSAADHDDVVAVSGATSWRSSPATNAYEGCRSDTAQSKGIRTVTVALDEIGGIGVSGPKLLVGLASGKWTTRGALGLTVDSIGYNANNGNVLLNSTVLANVGVGVSGDAIGIRSDLGLHTAQFNRNGGAWSAALDISSLGPQVYVACALGNGSPAPQVTVSDTNWNDFLWPTMTVSAHGDSFVLIAGVQQTFHPRLLSLIEASRSGWASGYHIGINGASWNFAWTGSGLVRSLIEDAPLRVDGLQSPDLPNWLLLQAGTNGPAIAHHTAAQEYDHFLLYFADRLNAGWIADHIVVGTMLYRGGVAHALTDEYNGYVNAGAATYGYRVANHDPALPLQPDQIHPTEDSQQAMAQNFFEAMQ
jgi:hypothetical protein